MNDYAVWIEAECWEPDTWSAEDVDTDVIVTWNNGERWMASFITYKHVQTLAQRYKENGECLHGAYIWMSDMILIDVVTRQRIEEVIQHLISEGDFETIFTHIPQDE